MVDALEIKVKAASQLGKPDLAADSLRVLEINFPQRAAALKSHLRESPSCQTGRWQQIDQFRREKDQFLHNQSPKTFRLSVSFPRNFTVNLQS